MEWKQRTGTQTEQPAVLDVNSSPSTVYLRKNILSATETDADGNSVDVWKYDECQISRADYEAAEAVYNELALMIEHQQANEAAYSDIVLQQADATVSLAAQDEVLADILLSVQGV